MTLPFSFNEGEWVVFDLDDTLYPEWLFLHSGIHHIIERFNLNKSTRSASFYASQKNWIYFLLNENSLPLTKDLMSDMLEEYRLHRPVITLREGAFEFLNSLKQKGCNIGLVTDGRSITQRNKLSSLGIDMFFDEIVISEELGSEKPSFDNFISFNQNVTKYYIGDNLRKDFFTPNQLGWTTIMLLDDGRNIHTQNLRVPESYQAKFKVESFMELI
jgi:putative hydrolase of the HAD superfamily